MGELVGLMDRLCPDGVEYRPLGSVGEFLRGSSVQKKHFVSDGVPCIHYGQVYTSYNLFATETISFLKPEFAARKRTIKPGDLFIAATSENDEDLGKAVAWLGRQEVVASNDAFIFRHTLHPKFVAYFFDSLHFHNQKYRFITGTKVRRISSAGLEKIVIPVPPAQIQEEIVRILDAFTDLEQNLISELELREKQFEEYRKAVFAGITEAVWHTLGSVSLKVSSGATPKAGSEAYYKDGNIPWLRTKEVSFNEIWDTEVKVTERALEETAVKWIPENCLIVAISGASAGRSAINRIKTTTNQHCCCLQLDPQKINVRYAFHWTAANYYELKSLGRGARGDLNSRIIREFEIAVPDLESQQQIVYKLDTFFALIESIRKEIDLRRKQYNYYLEELLTFTPKES